MTEPAYEGSDHMRGLPPDVQTTVGVIDGLRARIAELEARLSTLNEVETSLKKAEAERDALQDGINTAVKAWIELPYPPPGRSTPEHIIFAELAAFANYDEGEEPREGGKG